MFLFRPHALLSRATLLTKETLNFKNRNKRCYSMAFGTVYTQIVSPVPPTPLPLPQQNVDTSYPNNT